MADLRLVYKAVKGEYAAAMAAMIQPIAVAATGAIKDAAKQIVTEGRANIAAGGFSRKWQNALRVEVYPGRGVSADPALLAHHKILYAGVFETGATITGKPLLWIPARGVPERFGGRRLTPRLFEQQIGPLVLVRRPGHPPVLMASIAGRVGTATTLAKLRRGQRADVKNVRLQTMFIGLPSVTVRKLFDLQTVFNKAAQGLGEGYLRNLDAK